MKGLLFSLLICAQVLCYAQPSSELFPDFTETDVNGTEHSLYADYLNEGKTVVIDVFATWCSTCTNSLPGLHELENQYGENIVLLSFEKDAGTSNEVSWSQTNNVTNPIFANSLSVISDWNIVSQPNFFVICPDGSFELKQGGIGSNPAPLDGYVDECIDSQADGINEVSKVEFTITNNPVSEEIEFVSNVRKGTYTVVNLTGKTVLEGTFENASNSLDATSLEAGLYFLKLEAGNSSSVKKFIKS